MKALNKTLLVAAISLTGSSFTAFAATDGLLAATSSGTSDVTIIKENVVQITNVADLDLGTHSSLAADMSANDDVCVFNSTAAYKVTVNSGYGVYELRDGTEAIPYTVNWKAGTNAAVAMTHGTANTGNLGDRTSPNCGGGTNANFEVTVASADFNAALPGTYEDTITLMIEPE